MKYRECSAEIKSIIDDFKKDNNITEPLNGNEVDGLTEILKAEINLIEGNIIRNEYLAITKK
jgi:hypothetical protein